MAVTGKVKRTFKDLLSTWNESKLLGTPIPFLPRRYGRGISKRIKGDRYAVVSLSDVNAWHTVKMSADLFTLPEVDNSKPNYSYAKYTPVSTRINPIDIEVTQLAD